MNASSQTHAPRRKFPIILGGMIAQFIFIALGVFLGMQGDEWRSDREHRTAAHAALENFKREMEANRHDAAGVAPYHLAMIDSLQSTWSGTRPEPRSFQQLLRQLAWRGMRTVNYRHVAWDLSLATQSLSYLPPSLAFRIANVYNSQHDIENLQNTTSNNLFSPAALDDKKLNAFSFALMGFLQDMKIREPAIVRLYDQMIPAIDSALAKH